MKLATHVETYYFAHFAELEPSKQFHFAARLAAWDGNERARNLLPARQAHLLPSQDPAAVKQTLAQLLDRQPEKLKIGRALREPYLQKYPELYGLELAIFRVKNLKDIYGIDVSGALLECLPLERIDQLRQRLLDDPPALRYLSSYAVNVCYLVDISLHHREPTFDIPRLLEIGTGYGQNDRAHTQLQLYFYTHCILAATNFYMRRIDQHLDTYQEVLRRAEAIIAERYTDVSLDNKLEFLVCARICGYSSRLAATIYDECSQSLSDEGTFVIDRHNSVVRPERQSFAKSEHRNVLLIMSTRPYQPPGSPLLK
jgi:hypothetical protein